MCSSVLTDALAGTVPVMQAGQQLMVMHGGHTGHSMSAHGRHWVSTAQHILAAQYRAQPCAVMCTCSRAVPYYCAHAVLTMTTGVLLRRGMCMTTAALLTRLLLCTMLLM